MILQATWLYWPEELPRTKSPDEAAYAEGRRSYHGKRELIASNYMDVLDVLSFAGKAEVTHWLEEDDEDPLTTLYWRQTLNRHTGQLSVSGSCLLIKNNYKLLINPSKVYPQALCLQWALQRRRDDAGLSKRVLQTLASS